RPMRDTMTAQVVASMTIVGALTFSFLYFHPSAPPPNRALHRALGERMATEAVRLSSSGGRVVVIARETTEFESPAAKIQLESFERALQTAGKKVDQYRRIKVDPLRVVAVPP